eukprot:jgi/Chrzof1/4937/Cz15g05080.t1
MWSKVIMPASTVLSRTAVNMALLRPVHQDACEWVTRECCTVCCPSSASTSRNAQPTTASFSCSSTSSTAATTSGSSSSVAPTAVSATTATTATAAAAPATGKSRVYPDEPRVGVGVVVFKGLVKTANESPEVLLIRRAKEPAKGQWCFPGGSLELGETLVQCACREVLEETGLALVTSTSSHTAQSTAVPDCDKQLNHGGVAAGAAGAAAADGNDAEDEDSVFSVTLQQPTAFAAVDSIVRDDKGRIKYHYAIIEVAALCLDPTATPVAADDVDDVMWFPVNKLRQRDNLTKHCARLTEQACAIFDLTSQ